MGERWRVEAVADGRRALESALREPPELVLTDVMMPGLDGFGLLRAPGGGAHALGARHHAVRPRRRGGARGGPGGGRR
ncbi:hypothetical protein ACN28S_61915 [Cystobacter fuscus]